MTMKRNLSALPANDFDDEALDWLVRQQDGLTPAESLALEQWLAEDTRHRAAYEHWQDDWSTLDLATPEDIANIKQNLAADIAQEQAPQTSQQPQSTTVSWWQRLTSRPMLRRSLAAGLFTICGTSVVIWYQLHHYAFNETYVTAQGQQIDVVLPDDSHIWLDTATQAQVSLTRTHRQVILPEGQMVFHVQGDKARPFDVIAGNTRITVVGTRFSVRYTPDIASNNQVQVTVEEGRVRVAPTDQPSAAIALTAGQLVEVASNGTLGKIEALTDTDIGLWRNKRISFDNIPLSQALAEFDRYAPPRLHILDQKVASMRITGTFDPTNLDNFMRVLPRVLPVALLEQNGQTVIARK
jgi:transmembrane sensor